ncbi:head-tail adaptor protein [Sagittula marina]|uniref:head-tail adaptor protein n=1 Tax=Sagittula marina TaxID=943940 RepID=UPI00160A46A4
MSQAISNRRHLVAFDAPTFEPDGYGGQVQTWQESFRAWAEFIYRRGSEGVEGGRLAEQATFRVRVPICEAARSLTPDCRMRTLRHGLPVGVEGDALPGDRFNVRSIDMRTDPSNVWLLAESGVAV